MSSKHIFHEENEIRITDDSGGPAIHVQRAKELDKDYYIWLPLTTISGASKRINSDTLMSTGLTANVEKGVRYSFEAVLSLQRTNGSVAVYFQVDAPTGSDGQVMYHLPIATAWGAKDVNADSGNIGSLSVSTREILLLRGWFRAGDDGTLDLKMRINATDLAALDYYDVRPESFITIRRMA